MIRTPSRVTGWAWFEEVGDAVVAEARAAAAEEACGLLVGRRSAEGVVLVTSIVPTPNTEPPERRRNRFMIDPLRLLEVEKSLRESEEEVVGFYHTHPDSEPVPSPVDRRFMELWPHTVWVIAGFTRGSEPPRIRAWCRDPEPGGSVREIPRADPPTGHVRGARRDSGGVTGGAKGPGRVLNEAEFPSGKRKK